MFDAGRSFDAHETQNLDSWRPNARAGADAAGSAPGAVDTIEPEAAVAATLMGADHGKAASTPKTPEAVWYLRRELERDAPTPR